MTAARYATATAMRTALERRLRAQHVSTGLPLNRLRKEAALQRLLARIAAVAPEGSWALKGGIAMIARVGDRARATADADATWRASRSRLGEMLASAAGLEMADYFEFTIGRGKPIQGEGAEGGIRFPVTARQAGKVFENVRIDVNIVTSDPRPVEMITLRNLVDFADVTPVEVPAIRPEQQLAEKLHAYSRDYGSQENGRAKDLYDMLVIAQELPLRSRTSLTAACEQTFELRRTAWPPVLKQPPEAWSRAWRGFVAGYGTLTVLATPTAQTTASTPGTMAGRNNSQHPQAEVVTVGPCPILRTCVSLISPRTCSPSSPRTTSGWPRSPAAAPRG